MPEETPITDRKAPDLSRRYRIEVCFPEPDEEDLWDTITSFDSPVDALYRCSECLESVKDLLGTPHGHDLEDEYIRIRVRDAESGRLVLWEDERGALHADEDVFDGGSFDGQQDSGTDNGNGS